MRDRDKKELNNALSRVYYLQRRKSHVRHNNIMLILPIPASFTCQKTLKKRYVIPIPWSLAFEDDIYGIFLTVCYYGYYII